jgi:hypothetical protein
MAIAMDQPEVSNERRDMLEEALSYYEAFIEDRSGDQSVVRELDAAKATVATALDRFTELDAWVHSLDRIRLLDQPSVRKELGITSDQAAAALRLASTVASSFPKMAPSSATTKQAVTLDAAAIDSHLEKILGIDQTERLRQIDRQLRGPIALSDADVAQQLSLTREQRDSIRTVQMQYRAARFDARQPNRDTTKPSFEAVRREMINRVLAELTPDQVEKWKALTGAPFTGHIVSEPHSPRGIPPDRAPPPPPQGAPPEGPPGLDRDPNSAPPYDEISAPPSR